MSFEVPTMEYTAECTSEPTKVFTIESGEDFPPAGVSVSVDYTILYLNPQQGEEHDEFVIVWTEELYDELSGELWQNI